MRSRDSLPQFQNYFQMVNAYVSISSNVIVCADFSPELLLEFLDTCESNL